MKPRIQNALAAAAVLCAFQPSLTSAQVIPPFGPQDFHHDLQLFAPVELDFGNEPAGRRPGYFFNYDKLYWSFTGERNVLGDPSVNRLATSAYYDNVRPVNVFTGATDPAGQPVDPLTGLPINPDTGNPIQPLTLVSTVTSTVPEASLNWGDRFEFGYQNKSGGWVIGVLDGPEISDVHSFGLRAGVDPDTIGLDDGDDGAGDDGDDALTPAPLVSPFGDVYIGFRYQEGLMHGFLDLIDGGAQNGGAILPGDTDGDGVLDGDGFADDLDNDGQFGPHGFDIDDPPAQPDDFLPFPGPGPDGVLGTADDIIVFANQIPDYDDLAELPTSFNSVTARNTAETNGIELMRSHIISNRHFQEKNQHNHFELYYGARYLRFSDAFRVDASGGVLGTSFWDTSITNNLVGPQVGGQWLLNGANGRLWSKVASCSATT